MNAIQKAIMDQLIQSALDVLNRGLVSDEDAISALVTHRVPCCRRLAVDPEIQVGLTNNGYYEVGAIGLINGIIGVDANGNGPIAAIINDDGRVERFERFEKFDADRIV